MQRIALRRTAAVVAAVVTIGAALTACSSSGSSSKTGDSGGSSSTKSSGGSIAIGQVGAYSGQVPGLDGQGYGLEAWVDATNAKGGIDGHKITLYKGDSKGDPTTEASQIVQIATQHKVVAFAGMGTFSLSSSTAFIKSQKIAVVGGNISDNVWQKADYLYPQGTSNVPLTAAGFGHVDAAHSKWGIVYCKESSGCTQVYDILDKEGLEKQLGGDPVYSAEASLAAPSFTAQCLAAKSAGVQTLAVAFDPVNMVRLASDCAKQGFNPIYTSTGTSVSDVMSKSGHFEGAFAGQANAPWFLPDAPVAEMRAAMAKYEAGKTVDAIAMQGWVSGVVLGQAIENAYKSNGGKTLTKEDILQGLGQIKNDTFNGLTVPLTYTSSGVQPTVYCYFGITVKDGQWTAPNGLTPTCPSSAQQAAISAVQTKILSS